MKGGELEWKVCKGASFYLPRNRIPVLVIFFFFKSQSKYIWEQGSLGLSGRSVKTFPL